LADKTTSFLFQSRPGYDTYYKTKVLPRLYYDKKRFLRDYAKFQRIEETKDSPTIFTFSPATSNFNWFYRYYLNYNNEYEAMKVKLREMRRLEREHAPISRFVRLIWGAMTPEERDAFILKFYFL
jgi:hypothetical protein